jgi:hypothetical protein
LPPPAHKHREDGSGDGYDRDREQVSERFSPGAEKAADWHRYRTNYESTRCDAKVTDPQWYLRSGGCKQEIEEAEAKEGDVTQAS